MKIYDTNYGPDTFGRIRMGLITEMFLTYEGYLRPECGDQLRINCLFKGVVRDVYTVVICQVSDCLDEQHTVLIQIKKECSASKVILEELTVFSESSASITFH